MSEADLRRRRESLRQGLNRASAATVSMVLLALGLSAAAVLMALQSQRDRLQAERARAAAETLLYESSLAPIRAQRLSGRIGHRLQGLAAVEVASRIRPSDELRAQAISILALADLEPAGPWRSIPTNAVYVAVDPSHERYAVVSEPYTIVVHRLSDQRELFRVKDPTRIEPGPGFCGVDQFLYSASPWDVRIWNATNGDPIFELEIQQQEDRLIKQAFAARPEIIATTDARGILRLRHMRSGAVIWETSELKEPGCVRFDPSEERIAIECRDEIQIWNWREQKISARIKNDFGFVTDIQWQSDGKALLLGCNDHSIQIWDIEREEVGSLRGHTREVVYVMPHPREPFLLSYSWDNSLRLWDLSSGNALLQASGMMPLGFSLDGATMAVWNQGRGLGLLKVHRSDVYTALGATPGLGLRFNQIDFSPKGSLLAAVDKDGVYVWDAATGERKSFAWAAHCLGAWFEREEGNLLIARWDGLERRALPVAGAESSELRRLSEITIEKGLRIGSSSPNRSRSRLVGHVLGTSRGAVFDTATGKVVFSLEGQGGFSEPVFSPDDRWIASGCWDPTVTKRMSAAVWDATTGRMITNFPSTKCTPIFSPDSRWLMLCGTSEYAMIDTASWNVVRRFERKDSMVDWGHAAFAPMPGVAALHATDRSLRLVDTITGTELAQLEAPDKRILKGLAFSGDGRYLAAATEANVQLWNLDRLKTHLGAMGLSWEKTPLMLGRSAVAQPQTRMARLIIPTVSITMMLTVTLALLLVRHQRQVLARYQEVDAAIADRNEELAATQRELMHSQKMRALGTLAAGIAHDFNNLLSVIRVSNRLVARRADGDDAVRENTAEIEQAVQQGKNVVQSMLGYSREDVAGAKPFVLAELVEDVVALLSKQFLAGITLTLDLDRSAPALDLPRARIEQLLLNLVVNASEAMDGHGRLTLAVRMRNPASGPRFLEPREAASYVEMIVTDSGAGIAAEILPRIFEPFFTTKRMGANRGTGLGLSMVYTIARDCGLGIAVESEPGHGSRFMILFPAKRPKQEAAAPGRDSRIPTGAQGSKFG